MASVGGTKLPVGGKDSTPKMDIVKEVESALEEEGYVKIDSTSPSAMSPSSSSSSVSLTGIAHTLSGGSVQKPNASPLESPGQMTMRTDTSPSIAPGINAAAGANASSSSSTWQRQGSSQESEDESGTGVWSWMSSAVSAGLQTTQNIGRNIVEKTKVKYTHKLTFADAQCTFVLRLEMFAPSKVGEKLIQLLAHTKHDKG